MWIDFSQVNYRCLKYENVEGRFANHNRYVLFYLNLCVVVKFTFNFNIWRFCSNQWFNYLFVYNFLFILGTSDTVSDVTERYQSAVSRFTLRLGIEITVEHTFIWYMMCSLHWNDIEYDKLFCSMWTWHAFVL